MLGTDLRQCASLVVSRHKHILWCALYCLNNVMMQCSMLLHIFFGVMISAGVNSILLHAEKTPVGLVDANMGSSGRQHCHQAYFLP